MKKLVEYYENYDVPIALDIYLMGDDSLKYYEEEDTIHLLALTQLDDEYDSKVFSADKSAIKRLKKAFDITEAITFSDSSHDDFFRFIQNMIDGAEYGLVHCRYTEDGKVCFDEDGKEVKMSEAEMDGVKDGLVWQKIKDADNEKV